MRRLLLSPSWLVRHGLAIGLTVAFILLGRWQWHRAEGGNSLSYAYTVEWPLFAAFVVFFWWKMLRFEINPPADTTTDPDPDPAADSDAECRQAPGAVLDQQIDPETDPELAAYNRYLADLDKRDRNQ